MLQILAMSTANEIVPIVGTGALAIGLSYFLKETGETPRLIGREGPLEVQGYRLKTGEESWNVHVPAASKAAIRSAPLSFVAVKAYQLKLAIVQHGPALNQNAVVIPIGNGAVDRELMELAEKFPALRLRLGITTMAVTIGEGGRLSLRNAEPKILWGPLRPGDPMTEAEKALIAKNPSLFSWNDRIEWIYRKKWLFNTVVNTLAGVMKLEKNGLLLKHPKPLMRAFAEAYALAEELWTEWPEELTADGLFDEMLRLIESTFENENSMARDVRLGRPTETGYLAGMAREKEGYPFLVELDEKLRSGPSK